MATEITVNETTLDVTVTVSNERGPAGANGPNSVTSATTSDGTADLSVHGIQASDEIGAASLYGTDINGVNLAVDNATLGTASVLGTLTAEHIHGNLAGSLYMHVRAGENLSKGDPVYVSGSHGSGPTMIPIVSRADASDPAKMPAIAIMDSAVAANANGHAVISGTITDFNTDAYTVNATLYVANGGGLTATKPTNVQPVARVERVNTNNGGIVVKVNGLYSDISPANIGAVADDDPRLTDARPTTAAHIDTALQLATAAQENSIRSGIKAPKNQVASVGVPASAFMSGADQTNPQVRALYFGDSVCYPPDTHFRTLMGSGGYMINAFGTISATYSGGAEARHRTSSPADVNAYARAFTGSYAILGASGQAVWAYTGASAFLARQIQVWFWSETGGGTFRVEFDTNQSGSYTTLTNANSTIGGNAVFTDAATGVINAAEGGSPGALRVVTFELANPTFVRIRTSGLSGSAKIVCAGGVEVPNGGLRLPGFVGIDCSQGGSDPTEWDDIPDAALATIMTFWNPNIIHVRGAETLAQWQNNFAPLAAKIRALKPDLQWVVVGMHVTGGENTNELNAVDAYQQQWCDENNGTFIPVRNRMGLIDWSIAARLAAESAVRTITGGVNATGVITTSVNHGLSTGGYIRFETLTGGSNLQLGRAYRVLTTPALNAFTVADIDGTTPVSLGSDISGGSVTVIDAVHLSTRGQSFVRSLVLESLQPLFLQRLFLNGWSPDGLWQRDPILPSRMQPFARDRFWMFTGPSFRRRAIAFCASDGSPTAAGYLTRGAIGVNSMNDPYIAGHNNAGWGMTWDANNAIIGGGNPGADSFRSKSVQTNGFGDCTEIFSPNASLRGLAISSAATTTAHAPLLSIRNGASSSSRGTQVAAIDALGRFSCVIPEYANDAAADADTALASGSLYRTTAGGRAVFRKP